MIRHLTLCALLFTGIGALPAQEKPAATAETPKVERLKPDQWCTTHDIPKDVDGACDRKLIPALKKAKGEALGWTRLQAMARLDDSKLGQALSALTEKGVIAVTETDGGKRWTLA